MEEPAAENDGSAFFALTPDVVLDCTEQILGSRCTTHCRPLNSYINRVYEVKTDEQGDYVIKFYRPGRWSLSALRDEHDFLQELTEADVPVIAPIPDAAGNTLLQFDTMYFTVFPKKGGRVCDEPKDEQWRQLGRLLARTHLVGEVNQPCDRIIMRPAESTAGQLDEILASGTLSPVQSEHYEQMVHDLIHQTDHLFDEVDFSRIHGDCHYQNIITRDEHTFYIIDFDDMAVGPPVQDIWMLLPGRLQDSLREADLLLEGYETFRTPDLNSFRLIEPLRAMRYIHYTAWCARQAADGGFSRLAPDWGTQAYWQQEIHELQKQLVEIDDALSARLPF